jgi:glycerophosphoryl diester phosphodiesterase
MAERPIAIAHRGSPASAPENTLTGYLHALDAQADMIEVDIRVTVDGRVVLLHDADVEGSTDGAGDVSSLTFDQVRRLDAGAHRGGDFAGERVPTLVEAVEATRGRAMLNLDIKDEAAIAPMVRDLRARNALRDVVVTGCTEAWAALVHAEEPALPVFLNMDAALGEAATKGSMALAEAGVARALAGGLRGLNFHHGHVDPELIGYAHARGVAVWTWTVDDTERMRELAAWGVDAVTSNDPAALTRTLGELS